MQIELTIDQLSGHGKSGLVGKRHKGEGESVVQGETLITLESEKGTALVKSPYDGTLLQIMVEEGQTVQKGQVYGILEVTEEAVARAETKAAVQPKTPSSNLQGSAQKPATGYSFGLAKAVKKTMEVDLTIVGGGPGGYVAAIRGAQAGLKVALIEEDRLGGTCLNYGCIPTKAMASSVDVLNRIRDAKKFGFKVSEVEVDFGQLIQRKNGVVDRLVGGIEYLMTVHGIDVVKGTATVGENGSIAVKNKQLDLTIHSKNLILAMGSSVASIPIEGADAPDLLTSKELLSMTEIPKSLLIIGGGVIGMEFAFIYRALGSEVTVVESLPQILNLLDGDVAAVVRKSALERGIKIIEGAFATSIRCTAEGQKNVELKIKGEVQTVTVEKVAMAVGRKANLESLNLEALGVALNERGNGIAVDDFMRTSVPNIYAIGDVTNMVQLAHVASHQGLTAVDHILGSAQPMNYKHIPSAIFTNPEVGHVGLTEKDAETLGISYLVSKFPFMANGKALAMGEGEGFVKLIADSASRTLLGGTVVGVHATDLMATVGNLVATEMTIDQAAHVIYAHPTTAESIHEALLMLDQKGIHFA